MIRMKHSCLLVFLFVWLGGWRVGCARDSMGSSEEGDARGRGGWTSEERKERQERKEIDELWGNNGAGSYEMMSIRRSVDSRDVMEIVGAW